MAYIRNLSKHNLDFDTVLVTVGETKTLTANEVVELYGVSDLLTRLQNAGVIEFDEFPTAFWESVSYSGWDEKNNYTVSPSDGGGGSVITDENITAIGNNALISNTTGTANTAEGVNALQQNTTGSNNTSVGKSSSNHNSIGKNNTAVGVNAMHDNISGSNNTSMGVNALYYTTTGRSNAAYGMSALVYNRSGNENASFGVNALRNNTIGNGNTGMGHYAGSDNTTGSNTTCIGYDSKNGATNKSNSVTLGNASIDDLRCNDTSISALSDERDKTRIIDSTLGLEYICLLRPVEFEWRYRQEHYKEGKAPSKQGTKEVGFIAQELKAVQDKAGADHLKTYHHYPAEFDEDGSVMEGTLGIDIMEADYGKLLPVMVQAIKELNEKVIKLEKE